MECVVPKTSEIQHYYLIKISGQSSFSKNIFKNKEKRTLQFRLIILIINNLYFVAQLLINVLQYFSILNNNLKHNKKMKSFKNFRFLLIVAIAAIGMSSCLNDQYNEIQSNSMAGFDFKTINNVNVTITAKDNSNLPMSNVRVMLYTQNPLNEDGTLKQDNESYLLYTGTTDMQGKILCQIAPATFVDSIKVLVNQIGFPALQTIKINSADMTIQIGGSTVAQNTRAKAAPFKIIAYPTPTLVNGYYVLGTWTNAGVPNYLKQNDVISASLLADINSTLPEYKKLPQTHPEFFNDPNDGSVKIYEDAEVFVTFVHEGAGWMNMLSYYTYPSGSVPQNVNEITNKTVIFPNVSFSGSGGGLNSGNKVQLYYLQSNGTFSNIFPKGTTVSWCLQAQGWAGPSIKAVNPGLTYYSNAAFSPETEVTLKKHNVVLHDAARNLLLIGFEDMRRDNGADNDFNDAVFYATTNPITAINPNDYQKVIKVNDTDGDGVSDENDDYPADPKRAHNNYYPAKNLNGTLAFEDLWPSKGDYDFNDLVVDYNYNQVTNANNEVVSVNATYTVRAFGASYSNGFGVQFNTTPDNIISVSGQKFTDNILNINANGTEKNQSKAVVMVFDNAQNVLIRKGTSTGVNTVPGNEYVTPVVFNISFELKTPVASAQFGAAPYNPFIFINADRSREVHLPKNAATDLADVKLFGTHDDDTNLSSANFYMSNKYLPWAINIPVQFTYPIEKEDITKAYLMFNKWATSKGTLYTDWYLDKTGYRDATKLYVVK